MVPNQVNAWHPAFRAFPRERIDTVYTSLIRSILSCGLDVVMLPQLFDLKRKDRPYFMQRAEGFDAQRVIVLPDTYDSDVQQRVIAQSLLVVGARSHSIVFAINNDKPFLCLSYEHKMLHMLKLLGLEAYSLPLESVAQETDALEAARRLLSSVLHEAHTLTARIQEAHGQAEATAKQSFSRFVARL